ncbi:hypothetical protein DSO57_1003364 [Entomophthora muscae]|uniref:Uncharacterized protein n=1 Tax=Entomophthora muscae TaxID=34485 RepID=A0ACC2SXD5_9FUNG|nr:hypothetical protein DSO57_1003364 [Entomophthora muscae]
MAHLEMHEGKTLFLTGSTGFVGMAVLERLLRTSQIGHIYCLVRAAKGIPAAERLTHVFENPLFDSLRSTCPDFTTKVTPVEGDLSLPSLGLSSSSFTSTINTIIHCAASIEFTLPIKDAFEINTAGVMRILELAEACPNLDLIVHVSTAYVNCNQKTGTTIEEKIYPIQVGNPQCLIGQLPFLSQKELDCLEECVLKQYPNTYTFTKALTEHVLLSKRNKWDIAIVRPSIITPTLCNPIPGWTHGLAAAGGSVALIGMGLLDSLPAPPNGVVDFIPVDYVVSVIINAFTTPRAGINVYHATSSCLNPMRWEDFRIGVLEGWQRQPALQKKMFPIQLELIPDLEAHARHVAIVRQKKFLETAAKMDPLSASKVLSLARSYDKNHANFTYFEANEWMFTSKNAVALENNQTNVSSRTIAEMDWLEYMHLFTYGIRHYVLEKSRSVKEVKPTPSPGYQESSYANIIKL